MGRKPPIEPAKRREWFRRYEEDGQSAQYIAKDAGYDVRTVRKQIEIERQERERKETKYMVLRNALEKHYADLCAFAKKLEAHLGGDSNTLIRFREDRKWSALREHMPRSVLWKTLEEWESLRGERARLRGVLERLLEEQIKLQLKSITSSPESGFNSRLFAALNPHIQEAASGQPERLQNFYFEKVPESTDPAIADLIKDLLKQVETWKEYNDLERISAQLRRVHKTLDDELAIITLRRVVPGRCRYCPV